MLFSFGLRCFLVISILAIVVSSCAPLQVQINKIPEPEQTAKLRVFVLPISSPRARVYTTMATYHWPTPDDVFIRATYETVGRFLQETGIYDVIPAADIERVLGKRSIAHWEWKWKDYDLAKRVGKALHADYIFINEREDRGLFFIRKYFINLETGKHYLREDNLAREPEFLKSAEHGRAIMREQYRDIFSVMKADLYETALRKVRILEKRDLGPGKTELLKPGQDKYHSQTSVKPYPENPKLTAIVKAPPPSAVLVKVLKEAPFQDMIIRQGLIKRVERWPPANMGQLVKLAGKPVPVTNITEGLQDGKSTARVKKELPSGKTRIIIYDFNSPKYLEVATLILTEALREELFNMGPFILVNRDEMSKAINELKLQQSGLLDEEHAVRIGEWLTAHEMVTGNLGALGPVQVLSARRTDIGNLKALGMGSIKCPLGKEEELLNGIPELARTLAAGVR